MPGASQMLAIHSQLEPMPGRSICCVNDKSTTTLSMRSFVLWMSSHRSLPFQVVFANHPLKPPMVEQGNDHRALRWQRNRMFIASILAT
jgi:hypothetical protein